MSKTSLEDIKEKKFWVALFAELLGTMFLVLVSCGSATQWTGNLPSVVQISLCFGFSVGSIVWCIAHISGGHINPAVTIGFLVTRKISIVRFIAYVIAQCLGAIIGAGILKALIPEGAVNGPITLGTSGPGPLMSAGQTLGVELLITFIFVFTVFATCDDQRQGFGGSGPLAIGLAIAMCHLWAVPFTGAGMNPARVLGPAIVSGTWTYHWVYWVGPLIGGAVAALLYDHLFSVNANPVKTKAFFTEKTYDNDKFVRHGRKEDNEVHELKSAP